MPSSIGATTQVLAPRGGETTGVLSLLVISRGAARVVPLEPTGVELGRAPAASVTIDEPSLSRLHARFRPRGDAAEVEDLGSANGTVIGGVRLAPNTPTPVAIGESVQLGEVTVVVQRRAGDLATRLRPEARAVPFDDVVDRVAASGLNVLILGETGVGKEVMAGRLHASSPRRQGPLVSINCAALSGPLLESELFGHERGAFTGALRDKAGLVESAEGGTLFLDEIGEIDPSVQVKLLRVLEARETQRIGALRPRTVDVRFVAATNRVPSVEIREGRMRSDLYFRLAGFTLTIPPLRDRRADLPQLAHELLAGRGSLAPDAVDALAAYPWPGNIRELRNVLDRACILVARAGDPIAREDIELALAHGADHGLADVVAHGASTGKPGSATPPAGADDRERVLAILEAEAGNQTRAAERLGMSRRSLVYRLQAWGLTRPRKK